ncbi:uncharacterized protein LOC133837240 isoform X2 [Drosophila sulfurigaster albostrigata]|uniref:uncharacterized protein LOC133837240 isoform X2 n=1 Tax=Drosophila sulfurigaster albostrigata TaxID=89887 RepID=UPI002D21C6A3|nr:uncharacterized protein LOC133837240 isoform X2 [Drosophila sulfurigaster albostrigata]
MHLIAVGFFVSLVISCSASISGPYLFWGHEKLFDLQPQALVDATTKEQPLTQLFKDAKAIIIFVRNTTSRLEGTKYPKFQNLVKNNAWTYLPQRNLAAEPYSLNANIEVINLTGNQEEDDGELIRGFNDALSIYGHGEVLGILANREEEAHFLAKREAKEEPKEEESNANTTPSTPAETATTYIYVAEGNAALSLSGPPELHLGNETLLLAEHNKLITFDDQRMKGYGRLSITFMYNSEKYTLRFKFSLLRGTWHLRNVEVDSRDAKGVLPARGNDYTLPSAPIGFSFRCSSEHLVFTNPNTNDTQIQLILKNYQVQPWLNGAKKFGDVYDCVGFITAPILAGLMVTFFLLGILSLGITAMLSMHTPNRFESNRNKQLTFTCCKMFSLITYSPVNPLALLTLAIELFLIHLLFVLIVLYVYVLWYY